MVLAVRGVHGHQEIQQALVAQSVQYSRFAQAIHLPLADQDHQAHQAHQAHQQALVPQAIQEALVAQTVQLAHALQGFQVDQAVLFFLVIVQFPVPKTIEEPVTSFPSYQAPKRSLAMYC